MPEHGFVMCIGDGDGYTVHDDLEGIAGQLFENGIERLDGQIKLGVTAPGFYNQNYISLFVGKDTAKYGSEAERDITEAEFDDINELLYDLLADDD